MDPKTAQSLLAEGKALLVDVREAEELKESGTAEGALWMPTSKMQEDEKEWQDFRKLLSKDKEIILYCRSGTRSGRVAEFLQAEGFRATNMGGFKDWKAAGLPIRKI